MLLRKTGLWMALSLSLPGKQYTGMLWAAEGDSLSINNGPGYSFSDFPKFRSYAFCDAKPNRAMTQSYKFSAELCEIRNTGETNDNR